MPPGDALVEALRIVSEFEGEWSNDPHDPGGLTRWGITERFLLDNGFPDALESLTKERAGELMAEVFWFRPSIHRLPRAAAIKTFCMAVNVGAGPAVRFVQRGLRALGYDVEEDGIVGPQTVSAAAGCFSPIALVAVIRCEAAGYYRSIVAGDESQRRFLNGWLRRAYS